MKPSSELQKILSRIDGRGYRAYRDIAGSYQFERFHLFVDHVQGDPFASPSRLRSRVSLASSAIPDILYSNSIRKIALCDFLARQFEQAIHQYARGSRGSGKSGRVQVDAGGQNILARTASTILEADLEIRFEIGLPAAGRRILGAEAITMFLQEIPKIVDDSLFWSALPQEDCMHFVHTTENFAALQTQLEQKGLVAFVANESLLPRVSGIDDRPMDAQKAMAFKSPRTLEVELMLPNPRPDEAGNTITGMGIPEGISLIVGGGYHGKSTLLQAIEHGIYPKIPGDGREYVVSNPALVKIRAEDGRSITSVDISGFIRSLPNHQPTERFSSGDASGSTSQAANICEAMETGAQVLVLDEDTCATNFMVRDARMQALVEKRKEPITPFLDRARELFQQHNISTILVMGGCGDYFDIADRVIAMHDYQASDVTQEAKEIARQYPSVRCQESPASFAFPASRSIMRAQLNPSHGPRKIKVDAITTKRIRFGKNEIILDSIEQLVDSSQTRAIAHALFHAATRWNEEELTIRQLCDRITQLVETEGLEALSLLRSKEHHPGKLAQFRSFEFVAALNRLRGIQVQQD